MAAFTWDDMLVEGTTRGVAPEPTSLPAGLDTLPPSYLRFIERFGYGRTAWLFLIFPAVAEGCDSLKSRSNDLRAMLLESLELELVEFEPHGAPGLLQRCVPFGIGENGETLVWDPDDRDASGELQIYLVGSKTLGVWRAGRGLEEFVAMVTSDAIKTIFPGHSPFPRTFVPLRLAP